MNLSTARSEKRAKEVGIRKVAGATKGLLISQFLGESILLAFISGVIALLMVQLCLPSFDTLVNKGLSIPYNSFGFWTSSLLFILFTGIIAGTYPAFFLSSFKPITVLKGTFKRFHARVNPRKVLVVLQFSFAIILMICTFIVVQQIRYAQNRFAGYERSQLVYLSLAGDLNKNSALFKNELITSGVATSVTKTNFPLTQGFSNTWGLHWQGKDADDKTLF